MIQKRAISHSILHQPEVIRNGVQYMAEPLGGFGVWNGQFEQPGFDRATNAGGWEIYPDNATSVLERVTGGAAGNWCFRGGNTQVNTRGGYILQLQYMPVDENRLYNIYAKVSSTNAAATWYFGCSCYTAAKVYISDVWTDAGAAVPVAWTAHAHTIGPAGTVGWAANTRYARVKVYLQYFAALAGNTYVYVDDIGFSPASF